MILLQGINGISLSDDRKYKCSWPRKKCMWLGSVCEIS